MPHSLDKLIKTLVLTLLCCTGVAQAKGYDVVILNGRVIDPDGPQWLFKFTITPVIKNPFLP